MSLSDGGNWAQIIALVVAIIALLWAGPKVIRRYFGQSQNVHNGSVGIQSGRDTRIEVGSDKAKPKSRK